MINEIPIICRRGFAVFFALYFVFGCTSGGSMPDVLTVTANDASPTETTETIQPSLAPGLWMDAAVPETLRQVALGSGIPMVSSSGVATVRLVVMDTQNQDSGYQPVSWVYVLVAPFPTLLDGVSQDDVRLAWLGDPSSRLANQPIWVDESTLSAFTILWGVPNSTFIRVTSTALMPDLHWPSTETGFGLIPFEGLQPHWKVLSVGGQSPIHNDFNMANYPLVIPFTCIGDECPDIDLPSTNRDPAKLTVVVMTGVTALVRGTAVAMEENGIEYPGQGIRDWLRNADLTHISNEIPFAEDCPYPDPYQEAIVFCSDPRYIDLLLDVGADIIELTGNHFQDWGSKATLFTLEMYRQKGLLYYGGGADLIESQEPILIEHNRNKLAFIGCNAPGPDFAWATESHPGAAPCGDYGWMIDEITRLKGEGYLPIVTFQHYEYYTPEPRPIQVRDFGLIAQAGAVIVSGSQAHAPQAFAFYDDTLILYGLGNLFFDQMFYPLGDVMSTHTRRELIVRHIFYDNEYISTELMTAMLEDYSRPRPMTEQERFDLLGELFLFSGWK